MRRILVPLDGSEFAELALDSALELARAARADVHLVRVHEWRLPPLDTERWIAADPEIENRLRAEEEKYLLGLAADVSAKAGIRARAELLEGDAVDTLAEYAADTDVDLIVMTTHGRGGISRVWLGSVAEALVRATDRPILLIRASAERANATRLSAIRRVLIPLDGGPLAEAVLPPAIEIGSLVGARYTLLHALPSHQPGAPHGLQPFAVEATREQRERAERYVAGIATQLRERGLDAESIVRPHAVPALAILDEAAAADGDATLIAMATHGRGGWSRIAIGSVADKVLRSARAPVLLYRPPREQAMASTAAAHHGDAEQAP